MRQILYTIIGCIFVSTASYAGGYGGIATPDDYAKGANAAQEIMNAPERGDAQREKYKTEAEKYRMKRELLLKLDSDCKQGDKIACDKYMQMLMSN